MNKVSVIFFGSFLHYSTKVAQALLDSPKIKLLAVVTTPPKFISTRNKGGKTGPKKVLKKTHTHLWAEENNIKVFSPKDLTKHPKNIKDFPKPDFFLTAGYGKLLPKNWLEYPKCSSLNLHFSLLPNYKGANPAEWSILLGEKESGVTLIKMDGKFDTGDIITRKTYPISKDATRKTLYEPLYDLAAEIARETLPICKDIKFATTQEKSEKPDAKRFTRDDGFIEWEFIKMALAGKFPEKPKSYLSKHLKTAWSHLHDHPSESEGLISPEVFIERATRALSGFPGLWTKIPTKKGEKRMKILESKIENGILTLEKVQVAGQKPATFNQIKNMIKK